MQTTAADGRERRIGYLCAFAVLFIWAGFLIFSRLSQRQAVTPWDLAALRYIGSFLAALPLLAIFGLPKLPPFRVAMVTLFAALGYPLLVFPGFQFAPTAHAGVLLPGMLPFFTAAFGYLLLSDPWTRSRLVALLIVACGILLLAFDTFGDHPGAWRGDLFFLSASASWSVFGVLLRRWRIRAIDATMILAIAPAPIFLPVWWLLLPSTLDAVPAGVVAFHLIFQGVFATVVAAFLFSRAVTALGPSRTTSVTALTPAMASLAAWPLLDEPLGVAGLAGIALVSLGMVVGVRSR